LQPDNTLSDNKHLRLVEQATVLKKAWLIVAVLGGGGAQLRIQDRLIPNYQTCENKSLKRHIEDLEEDFESFAKKILSGLKRADVYSNAKWFSTQYDQWAAIGFGVYEVGRVREIEIAVGKLTLHKSMDCPPYAQLFLQGLQAPAVRHPEYHLGSDLALLFNLFLDSETILTETSRRHEVHSSEHSQSLGRSVILTCFNLLESFVSGLALAWLMENPGAPPEVVSDLQNKNKSLRQRFIEFPGTITGRPDVIDGTCMPFKTLFQECKQRRDSIVHCEPGSKPTKWNYVKEHEFHSVDLAAVQKTVDLTVEAISKVWRVVHGREKPTWLPKWDGRGRFERVMVKLAPVGANLPVRHVLKK